MTGIYRSTKNTGKYVWYDMASKTHKPITSDIYQYVPDNEMLEALPALATEKIIIHKDPNSPYDFYAATHVATGASIIKSKYTVASCLVAMEVRLLTQGNERFLTAIKRVQQYITANSPLDG